MHGKVVDVQNLGEDIIKNRGEHCKTHIEPKLNQLSQRFEMITRRILHGQVTVKLLRHLLHMLVLSDLSRNWELTNSISILHDHFFMVICTC